MGGRDRVHQVDMLLVDHADQQPGQSRQRHVNHEPHRHVVGGEADPHHDALLQ